MAMEKEVIDLIKAKKLIKPGETIGVATSGGVDSMSLLHFLNEHKEDFDCQVVAITVDHMIRGDRSLGDSMFVKNWCRENKIYCHKFSVDAVKVASEKNLGIDLNRVSCIEIIIQYFICFHKLSYCKVTLT